jgi:hypothetical protein
MEHVWELLIMCEVKGTVQETFKGSDGKKDPGYIYINMSKSLKYHVTAPLNSVKQMVSTTSSTATTE